LEQRLRVIRPDYPTQLKVIWRNLPLPMHENARAAARAALAASEQGRFGEFTRLLFTNQNKLGDDDFERYASGAGLDVYRFREAASSDRLEQLAEADLALAKRFGVTGTPTSFINGRRINGARQEAVLRRLIDDALADAQQP
jgi:protein-disulfide isomerase